MQLSIITINYNNPEGLERTIKSVAEQSVPPFEYIVVDGASTSGDVDIIHRYENYITKWVSEPDGGIYAAINKGTRMASGDYCLFLNSGDTLFSRQVCEKIDALTYTESFLEGSVCRSGNFTKPNKKYTLASFLYSHNPFHQACLIKRQMIMDNPYDESFRIAGDLDFNIRNLLVNGCSYRPLELVISNYEPGGRSETVNHNEEVVRSFRYFQYILDDYKNLWWIQQFSYATILGLIKALTKELLKRGLHRLTRESRH